MGNSAAPPPGSSAGNTAHPQTHGSTETKKTSQGRKSGRESHKNVKCTMLKFMNIVHVLYMS